MRPNLLGDLFTTGRYAAISIGLMVALRAVVLLVLTALAAARALGPGAREDDAQLRDHYRSVLFALLSTTPWSAHMPRRFHVPSRRSEEDRSR